ncbi:hypothetical protein BpHYR1_018442 [Brachionus plicatilis]|uniref:Uncharacterized protein n=1 Tax=Brachionus plicatilis TaxID=10195 RepID=A0A3M7P4H9_BRAPC|nr:hypothetical protein BpHYR1_018442 [Brachionus plicatilis]
MIASDAKFNSRKLSITCLNTFFHSNSNLTLQTKVNIIIQPFGQWFWNWSDSISESSSDSKLIL